MSNKSYIPWIIIGIVIGILVATVCGSFNGGTLHVMFIMPVVGIIVAAILETVIPKSEQDNYITHGIVGGVFFVAALVVTLFVSYDLKEINRSKTVYEHHLENMKRIPVDTLCVDEFLANYDKELEYSVYHIKLGMPVSEVIRLNENDIEDLRDMNLDDNQQGRISFEDKKKRKIFGVVPNDRHFSAEYMNGKIIRLSLCYDDNDSKTVLENICRMAGKAYEVRNESMDTTKYRWVFRNVEIEVTVYSVNMFVSFSYPNVDYKTLDEVAEYFGKHPRKKNNKRK